MLLSWNHPGTIRPLGQQCDFRIGINVEPCRNHLGTILEPSARSASNVIFGRFVLSPGDLFKILKRRPGATASRGALALLGFFLEFYTRLRSSFRAHRNCVWRFKEADVRGANAGPNICEYIEFSGAGGRNLQTSSDPRPETSRQLRSSR